MLLNKRGIKMKNLTKVEVQTNSFDKAGSSIKTVAKQVTDRRDAFRGMQKMGIKPEQCGCPDEVVVNLKDKVKVKKWMLINGWDASEIRDVYPEL
jgi:hypothetical protein